MNTVSTIQLSRTTAIPSLSENKWLRYFNFIVLYIAQGIPEGMLYFGIPAWMAAYGKTAGEIGTFVAVAGLPWSFKIIVAPMMDRFSYLPMGKRRPWVIFGQLGLMASFIAMAFIPDPLNNLNLFMLSGFAIGFFGAFQDVATDGMAVDIIPTTQQARANGLMWGAKIVGTSVSLAIGNWLLHMYGFASAILVLSVFVCLIMIAPLCLRERPGEKLLPWTNGNASPETKKSQITSWTAIFKSLFKVFTLRNSLLLSLSTFLFMAACSYMETFIPIFTVQSLGWTDRAYSQFYATASLVGGIGGMLAGGVLIDRFGKKKMLNIYFLLLIGLSGTLLLLKTYWVHHWLIAAFMMVYQALYVFSSIGIFAAAMECCWKKVSATQFTLYMTIGNIGRIAGAKLIGPARSWLSWESMLLAFALVVALAWLIIRLVHIHQQVKRVVELENKDIASKLVTSPAA